MGDKKKYGDFFEEYLERGFGKVKVTDLEVMIFHWYLEKKRNDKKENGTSGNFMPTPLELSLDLSIPISRVKDLIYKESLVYDDHDEKSLKEKIKNLKLNKANFEGGGKWVLIVTDKFVREYVTNLLLTQNHSVKSDFVRDNLILDYDGFIFLCEYALGEPEKSKGMLNEIRNKTIKDLAAEYGMDVLSEFTNGVVSKSLFDVFDSLCNRFKSKK